LANQYEREYVSTKSQLLENTLKKLKENYSLNENDYHHQADMNLVII